MKPINLTKEEFLTRVVDYEKSPADWVYLGDRPCVLDFYASWCGPCKALAPILDELAEELDGKIYIYKIDTDRESELSEAFAIRSIPTLIFAPMVGAPQKVQGALPKVELRKAIENILLK